MLFRKSPIQTIAFFGMIFCICVLGNDSFSARLKAECGDYVTIGNKAKLKELRAQGYLPKMKAHRMVQRVVVEVGETRFSNGSYAKHDSPVRLVEKTSGSSSSRRTCSGPQCKSNHLPEPVKSLPILIVAGCELGLQQKSRCHACPDAEEFVGYHQVNQTPVTSASELERPPE